MKLPTLFALSIACLAVAGCENAAAVNATNLVNRQNETRGFPFRWVTQSVSGGTMMSLVMIDLPSGPTSADAVLKQDILALIAKAELTKNRTNPEVDDVKLMKDGREVWILKSGTDGIAYIVTLKASPQGGTDVQLNGPTAFSRTKH